MKACIRNCGGPYTDKARHFGVGWGAMAGIALGTAFMVALRGQMRRVATACTVAPRAHHDAPGGHAEDAHGGPTAAPAGVNLPLVTALAMVVLIDGSIIGIALTASESGTTLIVIATELAFVAASTAGSARSAVAGVVIAIGRAPG